MEAVPKLADVLALWGAVSSLGAILTLGAYNSWELFVTGLGTVFSSHSGA